MIKTVVFDIGNVLMGFDWWSYVCSIFSEDLNILGTRLMFFSFYIILRV